MRGRTNVPGGGMEINGDKINLTVKTGVTINEGDFVQIDDSIAPTTIAENTRALTNYIFNLSDGRQITFGLLGTSAQTYTDVKAIIDEIDSTGLISSNIYTVLTGLSATRIKVIELGNDQFLLAIGRLVRYGSSGSYYSTTFDFKKVTFDVINNTFSNVACGSIGSISGLTSSGSTYYSNPTLFSFKRISTTDIFIICSQIQTQPDTAGKLTAIVYDFENQTIKAKEVVTAITFNLSATEQFYNDVYCADVLGNRYVYNWSNARLYIFDYDGSSTITSSFATQSGLGILVPVDNNTFVSLSGTTASLYMIVSGTLTLLGTYVCPLTAYSAFRFNDKDFISASNVSACQMLYDSVNTELTFSDVSTGAFYAQGNICIDSQYICTYSGTNRIIAREISGSFYSFGNLQTVKKYANRIDGVAETSGVGGDTISVFVPST